MERASKTTKAIRTFSKRKLDILPPSGCPPRLNWICTYLPYKHMQNAHTYVCTYIRTYKHTYIVHTYVHTYTHASFSLTALPIPKANCFTSGNEDDHECQTHKATGVVVPQCLCIPKGLQQRVGLQDDILDVLYVLPPARHLGQVVHDELGRDSLPGSGLSTAGVP